MRYTLLLLLLVAGCEGLRPKPRHVPTRMEITPADTMILSEDILQLGVRIYDQDDRELEVPTWFKPQWTAEHGLAISHTGAVSGIDGGAFVVVAASADLSAQTTLRINPRISLRAAGIYVNQAIQNIDGSVPLIAGREGLLRIFVAVAETHFYENAPVVRVRVGDFEALVTQEVEGIQKAVYEGDLAHSYNVDLPGDLVRPGMRIEITYDPDDDIPGLDGAEVYVPEVVEVDVHRQMFVPTISTVHPNDRVLDWVNENEGELFTAHNNLPIGRHEIRVHAPYYTDIDFRSGTRSVTPIVRWLNEIVALRRIEGNQDYYYYGVSHLPYLQGVVGVAAGIGGTPVSVGSSRSPGVYAHELGHNMHLRHAPCGGAGGADPNFPYAGGKIGHWGWHVRERRLIDPGRHVDLMGYCRNYWISDYHFKRALDYRLGPGLDGSVPEPALMVWGLIGEGGLEVEPAFMVEAPPSRSGGPYSIHGTGPDGAPVFSHRFTPTEYSDGGGLGFNVAVPYDPDRDGPLSSVTVSGPVGTHTLTAGGQPTMAVIIGADGQVRAIRRDWRDASAGLDGVRLLTSGGLPPEVAR